MGKNRQYETVIELVEKLSPIWQERLGLSHYDIEHAFLDSYDISADAGNDFHTVAWAEVRWQYFQAKIKWFLPSAVRNDADELEKVLLHELCHVLLAPEQSLVDVKLDEISSYENLNETEHRHLTDRYYEMLEMSTEQATRALWRAYKKEP